MHICITCHVTGRKRLRNCSRRGSIPIHDLNNFTDGSQPPPIMAIPSNSQQVPNQYITGIKYFLFDSPGLLNRVLHILLQFSTPLGVGVAIGCNTPSIDPESGGIGGIEKDKFVSDVAYGHWIILPMRAQMLTLHHNQLTLVL